jgi:hypothetical protein
VRQWLGDERIGARRARAEVHHAQVGQPRTLDHSVDAGQHVGLTAHAARVEHAHVVQVGHRCQTASDEGRIEALFTLYVIEWLVQALIERELRRPFASDGIDEVPIDPEQRQCSHPAAGQVLRLFSLAERLELRHRSRIVRLFDLSLTDLQRQVLALLGVPTSAFWSFARAALPSRADASAELRKVRPTVAAARVQGRLFRLGGLDGRAPFSFDQRRHASVACPATFTSLGGQGTKITSNEPGSAAPGDTPKLMD